MRLLKDLVMVMALSTGSAAGAADSGFYFGVVGGQADYDFDEPQFFIASGASIPVFSVNPRLTPPPALTPFPPGGSFAVATSASFVRGVAWPPDADHEATAWGALAGYRLFKYAAVEVTYLDLGTLKRREVWAGGVVPPLIMTTFEHELETKGPSVSALAVLPVGKAFELYGRAGVLFADMQLSTRVVSSNVPVFFGDNSITFGSDSLLWGAGAQFNWGEHWTVRLDFQRFNSVGEDNGAGEADIDLLTLGVLYRL